MPQNRRLFVRPLRRAERKKLERLATRARDARQVNRAHAILLSSQHKTLNEISVLLNMPPTCVATWIRRYEAEGLIGLADKPRLGRPRKATPEYELRLLELVERPPQQLDARLPFSVWTAYLRPKHDLAHKQDPVAVARFKSRLRTAEKKWLRIPA